MTRTRITYWMTREEAIAYAESLVHYHYLLAMMNTAYLLGWWGQDN